MTGTDRVGSVVRDLYTSYPRPILWLIPGGTVRSAGSAAAVEVEPFSLSKTPVTNEQFEAFDPGFERSAEAPGDRDPAIGLSWEDVAEYCAWWAEVTRKPIRLPTEVEWEHACRGGDDRPVPWDDPAGADEHLWDRESSGGRLGPLEAKRANGFGLYGMLGGVWEWTAGGTLRGGSWRTPRAEISAGARREAPRDVPVADAGLRIAKSLR